MATTTTMSGAAFDQLIFQNDRRVELLEGELIELASATPEHQMIVLDLGASLRNYFRLEPRGGVLPDVEFAFGEDTRLRPDLAIILGDPWSSLDLRKVPIRVVPVIAVEVISPNETTSYSIRKKRVYLTAGVREVWQIVPEGQEILIYRDNRSFTVLDINDTLTTPHLPGWEISAREIFA